MGIELEKIDGSLIGRIPREFVPSSAQRKGATVRSSLLIAGVLAVAVLLALYVLRG